MDSLVTRITSEASQYVNNVDSWVVGFRNYYVSNLGHSQGLAKEENIDQIHSALAQFLYSPNGGKNLLKIAKKPYNIAFLSLFGASCLHNRLKCEKKCILLESGQYGIFMFDMLT